MANDADYDFYDWDGATVVRRKDYGVPEVWKGGPEGWVRNAAVNTMVLQAMAPEEARAVVGDHLKDKASWELEGALEDTADGEDLKEAAKPTDGGLGVESNTELSGGMNVQQIRDAGYAIDLPWSAPGAKPKRLRYAPATEGREEWVVPEGFTMGGIPWDELPPIEARDDPPDDEPHTDGDPAKEK